MVPQWRLGDRVRWQDKTSHFHRDRGDRNAEVTIANRVYRGADRGPETGIIGPNPTLEGASDAATGP